MSAEAKARVLARFDDGSPALLEWKAGTGSLRVLTSGWNPADSQLAVASKFPPLMQTLLALSGAGAPSRFQFQTGDRLTSPFASAGRVDWRGPDGAVRAVEAGESFGEANAPGIYTAQFQGQHRSVAVNLPFEESRTAPLSIDELARLGVPLGTGENASLAQKQESALRLQRAELESRQKLWRALIALALVVVIAEMLLSGWLARARERAETAMTAPPGVEKREGWT
jgi:hypothetical protein